MLNSPDPVFRRRTATLTGLIALGATMIAVTATSPIPPFWRGFMTGVWCAGTVGLMVWQAQRHRAYRKARDA